MPDPAHPLPVGAARRGVRAWASWLRARPVVAAALMVLAVALVVAVITLVMRPSIDATLTSTVQRGTLVTRLSEPGILRPVQSIVYRSPLYGREAEIIFLVPEGIRVGEGDLVVRLETTELARELERAVQGLRQADVEQQVAELEWLEAAAAVESGVDGEGALSVDETRTNLQLAERKVERLRKEYESLAPLLENGFITREELDSSLFQLEEAEAELTIARRRADVFIERTYPLNQQRAELQLAQREAQRENVRQRMAEARRRVRELEEAIEACSMYARRPGLVVYEEHVASSPRRKIRVGDRVTPSQGLVRIPEVSRMFVESSVREADVHRVHAGQPVVVRLEAFPELRLSGNVASVGTLARSSVGRSLEAKRFDLTIELDATDAELRPEMTARADILVSERTDVLLVPVNAVFDHDGMPVANVLSGWRVETRQVELGESNDRYVEVIAGLQEGDRVALTNLSSGTAIATESAGESEQNPWALTEAEATELGPR